MKHISLLLLSIIFFTACTEEDKTKDNPAPTANNTWVRLSITYDKEGYSGDSAIVNNLGLAFYIDKVELVLSDLFFNEDDDSVVYRRSPFILSNSVRENDVLAIPPGGYSGFYGLRLGLDSAANVNVIVNGIPSDSELNDVNALRADGKGIDFLIIRGRLLDPFNPFDTTGSIPLSYRIGTAELSRTKESSVQNFSVQGDRTVSLVLQIDLEPIFNDFDLYNYPMITTDPQNLVDFSIATMMADSLKVDLF